MYLTIDVFMNEQTTLSASTTGNNLTFTQNDSIVPRVTIFLGLDKAEILTNISRLEEQLARARAEALRRD